MGNVVVKFQTRVAGIKVEQKERILCLLAISTAMIFPTKEGFS